MAEGRHLHVVGAATSIGYRLANGSHLAEGRFLSKERHKVEGRHPADGRTWLRDSLVNGAAHGREGGTQPSATQPRGGI